MRARCAKSHGVTDMTPYAPARSYMMWCRANVGTKYGVSSGCASSGSRIFPNTLPKSQPVEATWKRGGGVEVTPQACDHVRSACWEPWQRIDV